jgi:hypothetical protein
MGSAVSVAAVGVVASAEGNNIVERDSGRVSGAPYEVGLELDPPLLVPDSPTEVLKVDSDGSATLVITKYHFHQATGGTTATTVTHRFRLAPASVAVLTSEVTAVRSPALPASYGQPLPDAGQAILSLDGHETNIGANQAPKRVERLVATLSKIIFTHQ